MTRHSELISRIQEKSAKVYVIGLGYIGLPTLLYYASNGINVGGLDINEAIVRNLESGIISMQEDGLEELAHKYIRDIPLKTAYSDVSDADICVLCLPSPIDKNKRAVNRYLERSVTELGRVLHKGGLILIESTVPVGTTDHLAALFAEQSGLKPDKDFWFAHCPERVLPGQVMHEIGSNSRLVGGVTSASTELATLFLSSIFSSDLIYPTTSNVSEAAKLAENAYRDVNIAYANELAKICTEMRIDVFEVIELANLHPRVEILSPGIGVGGYCLPKDGWLLIESLGKKQECTKLIPAARSVNDSMPSHVFERIRQINYEALTHRHIVGVLGLSFKPNVSDTRNSPSVELIHLLIDAGFDVIVYDPFVEHDFGARRVESLDKILQLCEILVLSVGHDVVIDELRGMDLREKVFVDPGNVMPELRNHVKQYIGLSV